MIVRATRQSYRLGILLKLLAGLLTLSGAAAVYADEGEKPVERTYVHAPNAPQSQTAEAVEARPARPRTAHSAACRAMEITMGGILMKG